MAHHKWPLQCICVDLAEARDMGLVGQSSVTWRWQQRARMSGETGFLGLSLGPLEPPRLILGHV